MKSIAKRYMNARFSIHPLFFLVGAFTLVFGKFSIFLFLTALALLHELGHAVVARFFGYSLKQIRLMPFGAELSGDDKFVPGHEFFICIAGPAVNVLVCLVCMSLWWMFPETYSITSEICALSLMFALFNLLPFFPLDGGRILVAQLSKRLERRQSVKIAKACTIAFSVLLFCLFGISAFFRANISFGIVAVSLFWAVLSENKNMSYERVTSKDFKRKKIASGLEQKTILVSEDMSIGKLFLLQHSRNFNVFLIVEKNLNPKFKLTEIELERLLEEFGSTEKVGDVLKKQTQKQIFLIDK